MTVNPELYSISVTLQPLSEAIISPTQGYQTYAFFLNVMKTSSPLVSEELHDIDGPRPFTISPLHGKFLRKKDGLVVLADNHYSFRMTFLKSDVFAHFLDGANKWGSKLVQIGPASFKVDKIDTLPAPSPAACFSSFQQLYDNASLDTQIGLEFQSPTTFRSGGKRNVLFPEPSTVFIGYLIKWQAFSKIKIDLGIDEWLTKAIVSRYDLETRMLDFNGYQETGFVGKVCFELDKNTPPETAHLINALADFAHFCGTGAKTTMGMGQTQRLKHLGS